MQEMLHRAGGPCDLVISLGWAESPQVMMGNLIELIRRTDVPEGKKILIVTDPMGVVMRDAANNRINTGGPKDVFWYSPDPNNVYCRHPGNGQVGKWHAPVRTHGVAAMDTNTGQTTGIATVPNTEESRAELVAEARARGSPMTNSIAGGLLMYSAMPPGTAKDDVEALAHRLRATYPVMDVPTALGGAYLTITQMGPAAFRAPEAPPNRRARRARRD